MERERISEKALKQEAQKNRREKQNAITKSRAILTGLYGELHDMNMDGDTNRGRKQFLLQEVRMTRITLRIQRSAVRQYTKGKK